MPEAAIARARPRHVLALEAMPEAMMRFAEAVAA
jgi:hypothetical protein